MGRTIRVTDEGGIELLEAKAGGVNRVTIKAPGTLAGDYTLTLPTALPTALSYLTVDAAGTVSHTAASAGSLDQGYDFGGAGGGRIIVADNGALEVQGTGGILISHTDPFLLLETTGAADYNWRIQADTNDDFLIQRGDQDADATDDTFETILALDAAARAVGINTAAPQEDLHLNRAGGAVGSKIRIQADTGFDASVQFYEAATARFEVGYDDSRGGLVVGLTDFTTDALFVEDSTGDVGINEDVPDARLHVTDDGNVVGLLESTTGTARLGLRDSASSDENQVGIQAVGDDLQLVCGAAVLVHLDAADDRVGIGDTTPSAKLDVQSNVASQITLFLNQDHVSGRGLVIDSEATSQPLIECLGLAGTVESSRGDINLTNRSGPASGPSEGDIWYDSVQNRFGYYAGVQNRCFGSRYGPGFGPAEDKTVASAAITATSGYMRVDGEGSVSDTLSTISVTGSGPQVGDLIVLTSIGGGVTITVDEAGNLSLGAASRALSDPDDILVLMRGTSSTWVEIAYSNNA